MSSDQTKIRIDLTTEQQAFVKEHAGVELPSIELTCEELEQRIAPESVSFVFGQHTVTYNP